MAKTPHLLAFDCETTGLDFTAHDVIDVAWIYCTPDAEEISRYTSEVRPVRFRPDDPSTFSEKALAVTGRTVEDLIHLQRHAPPIPVVMEEMQKALFGEVRRGPDAKPYSKDMILLGQNILGFDIHWLRHLLVQSGINPNMFGYHAKDTMGMADHARTFCAVPLPSLSLDAQCRFFGVERPEVHGAMVDISANVEVYRRWVAFHREREAGYQQFLAGQVHSPTDRREVPHRYSDLLQTPQEEPTPPGVRKKG